MTWSEQQKTEFSAPEYLRNVIRIITETGLRIYKELVPMKKDQLDLENRMLWIPDSKTPNGVAEVPLTDIAAEAFKNQLAISGPGPSCSRVTTTQMVIRRVSRRSSTPRCDGQVFATLASTISVRLTPRDSVPAALQTSGSLNCFGRAMRRCSRSTRK